MCRSGLPVEPGDELRFALAQLVRPRDKTWGGHCPLHPRRAVAVAIIKMTPTIMTLALPVDQ